jgi:branched-chain amino acid transport system ATP-binding protein
MPLLNLENITAFYGHSQALFDVNLAISEGEVLALMGRNGMGKSTTIKVICRLVKNASGQVMFSGQDIGKLAPHRVACLGIGLVPEGRRCFAGLSVLENLQVAARPGYWDLKKVFSFFPRLEERRQQASNTLSGGEQQMLAIGRALMINPKLLILDEATEGLAPVIRQEIWSAITRLKKETGLALLVVDKILKELRQVADRAIILERGRSVWTDSFGTMTTEIADRYLGV